MHCNFICSLSDVIIKTFSQSVSQIVSHEFCNWSFNMVHAVLMVRSLSFINLELSVLICPGVVHEDKLLFYSLHAFSQ